jgi:dihydrofolate synthase / folylpolyglutamate synthase
MRVTLSTSAYNEAVDWLFKVRRLGPDRTLEPIERLVSLLGNPQKKFRSIHVTGTNGKGSTSAMIASILRAAGYRVGLFTSPHLESFTERIVVDDEEVSESAIVRLVSKIKPLVEKLDEEPEQVHPLFFDIVTALAFEYFAEKKIDFAVLEVGIGGRLDATNIIHPLISIITNISLEHTQILGNTVLKIAYEKAGIIKPNSILVTATQDDAVYALFKETCQRLNTEIYRVGKEISFRKISSDLKGQSFTVEGLKGSYTLHTPLLGGFQLYNAAAAIGTIEALSRYNFNIPKSAISDGLDHVSWPGRLEVIQESPLVILDSAKDAEAMKALAEALRDIPHRRLQTVISISNDKNIPLMIAYLTPIVDRFIVTSHSVMGRAAERIRIGAEIDKYGKSWVPVDSVQEAVKEAIHKSRKGDMVLVTGSVFAVGEARKIWTK